MTHYDFYDNFRHRHWNNYDLWILQTGRGLKNRNEVIHGVSELCYLPRTKSIVVSYL